MFKFFNASNAKAAMKAAGYTGLWTTGCGLFGAAQLYQIQKLEKANPGFDVHSEYMYVPGVGGYHRHSLTPKTEMPKPSESDRSMRKGL